MNNIKDTYTDTDIINVKINTYESEELIDCTEYLDNNEINDLNNINVEDVNELEEIDGLETFHLSNLNERKHELITNVLNIQNKIKNRKEYEKWLNKNFDYLQSAFYIINSKYLDSVKNINITFKDFTEFCFLYY